MANEFFPRRFRTSKPLGNSVMFTAYYEDGRTRYFVIQGHSTSEGDYLALGIAQERQRTGELPGGVIRIVKRVR